jgi:glycogen synthase
MRVLRLCSVFEPPGAGQGGGSRFDPGGGMQTHTTELSRALDALGVVQTIITSRPRGAGKQEPFGTHGEVVRLGLPVNAFHQLYSWPATATVMRRARGADLIHVHLGEDLAVVPIALFAAQRHDLPTVLTVHSSMRHTLQVTGVRSALLKSFGGGVEWLGTHGVTAVIAPTERLAKHLEFDGVPAERIHVVPSGIVPDPHLRGQRFGVDPIADVGHPRVVFLGRLHRAKQVDVLIRAVARVPEAHLVIVGDGPHRPALQRLTGHLGLSERVHFRGLLPHTEALSVLHYADALALPSRYEEFGTSLLEGMQAGLPAVAAATGGIPDVIRHGVTGLLVPPSDPNELARALNQVLTDKVLAARLSGQAQQRVRDYEWDSLAEHTLSIYQSALEARTATPLSLPSLRDELSAKAAAGRRAISR